MPPITFSAALAGLIPDRLELGLGTGLLHVPDSRSDPSGAGGFVRIGWDWPAKDFPDNKLGVSIWGDRATYTGENSDEATRYALGAELGYLRDISGGLSLFIFGGAGVACLNGHLAFNDGEASVDSCAATVGGRVGGSAWIFFAQLSLSKDTGHEITNPGGVPSGLSLTLPSLAVGVDVAELLRDVL